MDTTRMLGTGEGYEPEEVEQKGHNPLLVVHLLLQGRYWIAVLLALVLGAAGVVLGYKLPKPTYSCSAAIHIRPVISAVLFGKDGSIPMYEQFVQTQMFYLKDQRCIDLAMTSPRWLQGGRSNSAQESEDFANRLTVERQGEFIKVTFTDPDAKKAADAVQALVDAYSQLTEDVDPENSKRRQQTLESLRTDYETKLAESQASIVKKAAELGMTPEALLSKYQYRLTEWNQSEVEARSSKAALDSWEKNHPEALLALEAQTKVRNWFWFHGMGAALASVTGTSGGAGVTPPPAYTAESIAKYDPEMRQLLEAKTQYEGELELLTVGPSNPVYINKKKQIELVDKQIAKKVATWKPLEVGPTAPAGDAAGGPLAALKTLQTLRNQAQWDLERYEIARQEATKFGDAVKTIREFESKQKQFQTWLDETKQKLEELKVEQAQSGHILIPRNVDRPVYKDKRLPIAAGSGFAGLVAGFALVVGFGLLDRRLRTIDQAKNSLGQNIRVLGMLPSLPKNLEDPAAASFAALCVHHIRMLLQVMPRLDGHPAIAVTSPSAGDGKTSLTLSLALSYAASGKSTLLIDCDMVGAGLTRRVNAIIRRRIGQILIRENLITPAELREALSAAQRGKKKLGEVLVDEGYVDADQLANALKTQGETNVGLLDVLRGEVLEDCVAETGTPRLWILPVGSALAEHGVSVSPEGFRAVLDQARKRFDVILVDTGPIPGSIESSVAASQTDGVVLCVSRGEQGPLVKRASEHLRDIGARALGVVFNRATPEDFSSSYGAMSSPSIPERVREKKDGLNVQAFGPVAAAVVGQQKQLKE